MRTPATAATEPAAGEATDHVYVQPGWLYFTTEPKLITTILGSCVSVCLYELKSGAGGMNHYLLPSTFGAKSPRFGDVANAELLQKFVDSGISLRHLQAKVFGGAAMRGAKSDLAASNICAALDFLQAAEIPLVAKDIGGQRGRKLHFRTSDGAAWVRPI